MEWFVVTLRDQGRSVSPCIDPKVDEGLGRLSRLLTTLAQALEVPYIGPMVGLGAGRDAFCLAVGAHIESPNNAVWSVRVCSAQPHAGLRANWDMSVVGRLRKVVVIQALPAFLAGYAVAVVTAGKGDTKAGRRLKEIALAFETSSLQSGSAA